MIINKIQRVPKKSFGQLLDISPKNFTFFKNFDSEFSLKYGKF